MLKNFKLNQTKSIVILLFFFLIQMFCYNYQTILTIYPRTIHAWRQSDCLNFTLNYYNNRATFWEPRVNNISNKGDSKTASDFPLVQYSVAQIWKVFGKSIMLFKLIDVGFLLLGLIYLFKLAYYWTKDFFLSIITTALIYTSPILAYYGPSFINEIQAFGLGFAGFYFTIKWLEEKKQKQFFILVLFFLFAGLAKVSIFFVYIIALILIGKIFIKNYRTDNKKQKQMWFFNLFLLLLPILICLSWSKYAAYYNSIHYNLFLVGIKPIWEINKEQKLFLLSQIFDESLPQMFSASILLFITVFSFSFLIIRIKEFFSDTYLILLSGILMFFTYMILFYQNLGVHDYYFIIMLIIISVILCLGIKHAKILCPEIFRNNLIRGFAVLLIIVLTYQTAIKTRIRISYKDGDETYGNSMVFNKIELNLYKFINWEDRARYAMLEEVADSLDGFHITKNDTVLVLGDLNSTRSLGIIDRVGYTGFNTLWVDVPTFIEDKKKRGLKFLFVLNPDLLNDEKLKPYLQNKIYLRNSTSIYKL
jgi:hypothetical protein